MASESLQRAAFTSINTYGRNVSMPKPKQTKTAFVLSFPPGTPAKEITARARDKGFKLSDRYVYVIRSNANAKARKGGRRSARGGDAEVSLRTAIAEIGLSVRAKCSRSRAGVSLIGTRAGAHDEAVERRS
jgi:hypothetical protein